MCAILMLKLFSSKQRTSKPSLSRLCPSFKFIFHLYFALFTVTQISPGLCFPENTPPVFDFQREWYVDETEPLGSRVITIRTRDEERDSIQYGIEPALFSDGSHFFRINSTSGEVFLKESLSGHIRRAVHALKSGSFDNFKAILSHLGHELGWAFASMEGGEGVKKLTERWLRKPHCFGGKDYYLFVSANDGHQTAKIEVLVKVLGINSGPNAPHNISYSGSHQPSVHRPFSSFNLPISFPRPQNPYFIPPSTHFSTVPIPPTKRVAVVPKTNNIRARPQIPSKPSGVSSTTTSTTSTTTAGALDEVSSSDSVEKENKLNATNKELHSDGQSAILTKASGTENGTTHRLDLVTAFLPLLAAIAFAPIVAIIFFVLHRQCNRDSKRNLLKSLSQKKSPANGLESAEISICSKSGDFKFNGAFFGEMNSKPALSRYETAISSNKTCKWEFPRHHLRFIGILGEGCFGQVWKCEALDICNSEGARIVAVKTLKENASEKEKKDLLTELEIMKILDPHPNVVTLLGCCTEREPVFLIMDYVPYGKLQTYLRDSRSEMFYGNMMGNLTSRDLTSFAYQVAKGMEYIASKGVIHRDLAARNILIGTNKTCKIADFGFARDVVADHIYERKSEGRLPIRWMALESLYDNLFTSKSDVWSFGILMWEIITLGSTPYPGLGAAEVMKKIRDGYRLEKPEHCKREMYNIMFYCWDSDPKERPSFSELVTMLDKLLVSENDYIELDRFPDHSYYNVIANLSGERL